MTYLLGAARIAPSEIEAMDVESFIFWLERSREYAQWLQEANPSR